MSDTPNRLERRRQKRKDEDTNARHVRISVTDSLPLQQQQQQQQPHTTTIAQQLSTAAMPQAREHFSSDAAFNRLRFHSASSGRM